ncbi:RNA polymerase sigma factor [Chitinophagaceae bacterium 26-R-25]|nr:RNA polymerase sigma factor [Chitinophagaceae bacterium 26-R-25]
MINLEPIKAIMHSTSITDTDIIEGLRRKDNRHVEYENALYLKFAYFIEEGRHKYSVNYEDAFSAYSDAVITVINNVVNANFQERSSLKTYLYQIFHNKCVDQVRKNTTKKNEMHHGFVLTDALNTMSDTSKTIIQQLIEKTDFDLLRKRLSQIGENCKQMLLLFADGFSDKEIAAMVGFKTAAVAKTSRLRCMEKLRHMYKQ